jgi:hypothetical protein
MRLFLCATILLPCAAFAQPDPQVVAIFTGISQRTARIAPMLDELRPNDWVAKGAPDTYVTQWNSAREQLQAIQSDMAALAQNPDQMTECMKALFRVQAAHLTLDSLMGGLRRWQNPALAELIESVSAQDQADLNRLEQYVLTLANEKDQQYAVVDREAQRCRGILSKQPAEPAKPKRQ